jgi:hypothetical protein
MDRQALLDFADRVEDATAGEQREMLKSAADRVWGFAFAPEGMCPDAWVKRWVRFNRMLDAEAYESAVLMLVPDGHDFRVERFGENQMCGWVWVRGRFDEGQLCPIASTPALALGTACLRAIAHQKEHTGDH